MHIQKVWIFMEQKSDFIPDIYRKSFKKLLDFKEFTFLLTKIFPFSKMVFFFVCNPRIKFYICINNNNNSQKRFTTEINKWMHY